MEFSPPARHRLAWIAAGLVALVAVVMGVVLLRLERFENVPAWTAHPDRIEAKLRDDGFMTDPFRESIFIKTATHDDIQALDRVGTGRGRDQDLVRIAGFLTRYRDEARRYGVAPEFAERQFFWSAQNYWAGPVAPDGPTRAQTFYETVMPTYRRLQADKARAASASPDREGG